MYEIVLGLLSLVTPAPQIDNEQLQQLFYEELSDNLLHPTEIDDDRRVRRSPCVNLREYMMNYQEERERDGN